MSPWERLGIDWDEYHPDARELLDDPFFWDPVHDSAPHGNDTGVDLLADFKKWNKRHREKPAHEMARALLSARGIAPIDLHLVNENAVRSLYESDPITLTVTDDALIATAFAAVKMRGCCDRETREIALKAMERELLMAVLAGRSWTNGPERITQLNLLAQTLRKVPNEQIRNVYCRARIPRMWRRPRMAEKRARARESQRNHLSCWRMKRARKKRAKPRKRATAMACSRRVGGRNQVGSAVEGRESGGRGSIRIGF